MIETFKHIKQYFQFFLQAKTIRQIHSPYLFDFFSHTLEDDRYFYTFTRMERLRLQMQRDKSKINIEGPGPNSKTLANKNVRVSRLVRKVSSEDSFCRFLFKTADYLEAKCILELGSSLGLSAMYLHFARPSAQLISIEGNKQLHDYAQHLAQRMQAKIEFVYGSFQDQLNICLEKLDKIDLVFVDGDHRGPATQEYWQRIKPHLSPHAIVIFDDIRWSDDMYETWKVIITDPQIHASVDLYRRGIVFCNPAMLEPVHLKLVPVRYKPWKATL